MSERSGAIRHVLEGRNGRLFLGNQDGFDLAKYFSAKPFRESQIEVWRRTIRRRARELAARAIPYVFCVVPDAHYVFREDLPNEDDVRDRVPPGEQFLRAMGTIGGVTFVDPRRDLLDAKGLLEVYRKTDSHWSLHGAFVGYKTLATALRAIVPMSVLEARDVSFDFRPTYGDLGVSVTPERFETAPQTTIERNPVVVVRSNEGFRRNGFFETHALDAAPTKALIMRDSFYTFLSDYVSRSFRSVLSTGATSSLFLDEVDAYAPDVVISVIGERRLAAYDVNERDHRREGFDDLFRTDFSSSRGRIAHRALLMLEAGRTHDARTKIEEFANDRDADPDHAYIVAKIQLSAGYVAEATAAIDIALRTHPGRASYASLAASIALARGDSAAALKSAENAIGLAPYNGAHHELYATLLINLCDPHAARNHLDGILGRIDDYGVLWYLYSHALEATGDLVGSGNAISEALFLSSRDTNFQARARRLWTTT